ncbi:unnamed protein product [Lupinus luteus]|uniref:Amino acid transporter transmembrane domain-containing protein n=1 Tax=Lupinus luteus TaxID=3873 RepID=A0AAV1Y1V3_LUPLU
MSDDALAKQKAIDDWLPITASRKAKWWYSAIHNVTAMVGAGVLSLPYAMSNMGCYSTIAWGASIHKGVTPNVSYASRSTSTSDAVFNFFSALGDVAFAYAGHNVILEIQATMPSTPENPSKKPMWKGVVVAYIGVAFCYFPVALIGYYMFGNSVDDNILMSLERPAWLIAAANLFVVVHVVGGYQIFAMPVFDMMETYMVIKLKFAPSFGLRLISRSIYVASLYHMAQTQKTQEIQPQLDNQLGI